MVVIDHVPLFILGDYVYTVKQIPDFRQYILPIHIFSPLAHSKVYFALNLRRRVHSRITRLCASASCTAMMTHDILVLVYPCFFNIFQSVDRPIFSRLAALL